MINDFAEQAWADAHEKFAADAAAGLTRFAGWLRRRAKAAAFMSHRGMGRRPQRRIPTGSNTWPIGE